MLTNEEKVKVLEALRSGKYNQTHWVLYNKSKDCYCAQGVIISTLLEIKDPYKINEKIDLNLSAYEWLYEKIGQKLSYNIECLNDTRKKSFAEIADYLENVWRQQENL